jgi:hypothetical protein
VGFTCSVCGEYHAERLLDVRLGLPDAIHVLDEGQRRARAWLADDFAVLDEERFFVRGLLQLPIPELEAYFGYGAWLEVDRDAFTRLLEHWHNPEQFTPAKGTLANELSPYHGTTGAPATLRATSATSLPELTLDDDAHLLGREQRGGISAARSDELAAVVLHR